MTKCFTDFKRLDGTDQAKVDERQDTTERQVVSPPSDPQFQRNLSSVRQTFRKRSPRTCDVINYLAGKRNRQLFQSRSDCHASLLVHSLKIMTSQLNTVVPRHRARDRRCPSVSVNDTLSLLIK